jgi:hydroxypyruvate isomerase
MPKFAANLSMMFTELPFLDRFTAASDAGFTAVEFLFPYEYSPDAVKSRAGAAGVEVVLFNTPAGDWSAGERGIACLPGREDEFRAGVEKALSYAVPLGTKRVHAMAGIVPQGASHETCRATLIENLKFAARRLAKYGITVLLEAINTQDMPGFIVSTQLECYSICRAVDLPNIKMQMDLYHMQMMEGNLSKKLETYAHDCGHIQIAGCPGRNEPDTGEIRYEYLFRRMDELNYRGWVGCEYRPAAGTVNGLNWMRLLHRTDVQPRMSSADVLVQP